MFGDRKLGRDLFFAAAILSAAVLVGNWMSSFPIFPDRASPIWAVHFWIGVLSAAMCVGLIVKTRSFLTEWRPAIGAGLLSVLGLLPYLYLPLASMTNPPSNWGYARSVEGFFHVLTRGQYEKSNPTNSFGRLGEQVWLYLGVAVSDVGWIYWLATLVPFCFLRRMRALERGVMLGF